MTSIKQESNILRYRKKRHLNIGIIIFGIIFIYLAANIIMYVTSSRVSVYEVRQGSILKDCAYTGLAIREETVVYADAEGYVNFYAEEKSKVKVGSDVYMLSDKPLDFKSVSGDSQLELSDEESASLLLMIQAYNDQFREEDFTGTYPFKSSLLNRLNTIASHSKSDQLNEMLSGAEHTGLSVKKSSTDGIILYSTDGMEDITPETVTKSQMQKNEYDVMTLSENHKIKSGEAVYKIVTSDAWQVLISVNPDIKEILKEKKSIKINFKKDNQSLAAGISFPDNTDQSLVCLTLDNSMIRYANDRYVDIEIILEDESGLKIPKSAEVKKDFYLVPKNLLTKGGDSSDDGILLREKESDGKQYSMFMPVTVYYEEGDYVYLDTNVLEKGSVLLNQENNETYTVGKTSPLKGVYCINKGYAVFKQVKILCESGEYYIIEEGSSFGLSNYDHIALYGRSLSENEVVF